MHQSLYRICGLGSRELLLVRLTTLDHGYGKHFLAEVGIDIEHLYRAFFCFLSRGMRRMAFLP